MLPGAIGGGGSGERAMVRDDQRDDDLPDRPRRRSPPRSRDPDRPLHLLQQLGEGGMGVVFRAEQSEPVERPWR
jgi:hypothetical protein